MSSQIPTMSSYISCPHCAPGRLVLNRFREDEQTVYRGICPLCGKETSIMLSKPGLDPDEWEYPWDDDDQG